MDRLMRGMFWLALLAPAAVAGVLIHRYGVNVPSWDQWVLVDPLIEIEQGHFPWAALFSQHNEHRMVFPKLVMLGAALVTRWNTLVELWASFALAAAGLAMLVALMRPLLQEAGVVTRAVAAFLLSAIVFTLAQWENWIWGWQIQWFLSLLAAVSTIALATWSLTAPRSWPYVAGAFAAAIVCQYSVASGVAAWVCGALILAFHPRRAVVVPLWLLVAAGSTALYFVGYTPNPGHPSPLVALHQPLAFLVYLGNYLAGPLGRHAAIGFAATALFILLAWLAISRHRDEPVRVLPWIAIAAFAGANAVLTGLGRVGMGAEQGLQSRYVTLSLLLAASLVPLGLLALRALPGRGRPIAGIAAALVMAGLLVWTDVESRAPYVAQSHKLQAARECLLHIDEASDECATTLFPVATPLRHWAKQLQAMGWSGFPAYAEQPPGTLWVTGPVGSRVWRLRPDSAPTGWLDKAELDGTTLVVAGWARHPDRSRDARKVLVIAGDPTRAEAMLVGEAAIGDPSPGLVDVFHDPTMAKAGWTLRVERFAVVARPLRFRAYLVLGDDLLTPIGGSAALAAR